MQMNTELIPELSQPPADVIVRKPRRGRPRAQYIVIDDTAAVEKYDVIQTIGGNVGVLGIVVSVDEKGVRCFTKGVNGEGKHFVVPQEHCKKIGVSFIRWKSIDSGQPATGQSNGQPRMIAKPPAFPPDVVQ